MKKIGLIRDPATGKETMQFLNGASSPFPHTNGLHISASSCGNGKTTLITEIAQKYTSSGILIITPTIESAEEFRSKIPGAFILHSNNIAEMEKYHHHPESLMLYDVLIITSARFIIDPIDLFLSYHASSSRQYVLVDELINFYPEPYMIPDKLHDTLTYIDTTKIHKKGVTVGSVIIDGKTYYQHTYGTIGELKAAYKKSQSKMFTGKNDALQEYKVNYLLQNVLSNGFSPIQQKIIDIASSHTVVLFDGTADVVFGKDKRILPLSGDRYNSNIEFIQFPMPLKRKNKDGFNVSELQKYVPDLLKKIADLTQTEKLLVVSWKTIDVFKNPGIADSYEKQKLSYDFPERLKEELIKTGAIESNLEVIYRGSGQDRGCNEFRDFSSIMFLGEWRLPDNITSEINSMFGCKCKFQDYKLSLLVQTICRIRIRRHQGLPIKVYFSDDIDYNLMYDVQNYFKINSSVSCKIKGLVDPCPKLSKPQKGYLFDIVVLEKYDPKISVSIEKNTPYTFDIHLSKLFMIIPMKRKSKDMYKRLVSYLNKFGITMNIK